MLTRMVLISWPRDPPASASQSAGITGVSHRAVQKQDLMDIWEIADVEYKAIKIYNKEGVSQKELLQGGRHGGIGESGARKLDWKVNATTIKRLH